MEWYLIKRIMKFNDYKQIMTNLVFREFGFEESVFRRIFELLQQFSDTFGETLDIKKVFLTSIEYLDKDCQVLDKILKNYGIDANERYLSIRIDKSKISFDIEDLYLDDEDLTDIEKSELLVELLKWEK